MRANFFLYLTLDFSQPTLIREMEIHRNKPSIRTGRKEVVVDLEKESMQDHQLFKR